MLTSEKCLKMNPNHVFHIYVNMFVIAAELSQVSQIVKGKHVELSVKHFSYFSQSTI